MRLRPLFAMLLLLLSAGCTRRFMQFDYDYPAQALASRVQVERRNREPLNAAAPLQISLHVNAPDDSALVLVVHDSVTAVDVVSAVDSAFSLFLSGDQKDDVLFALAPLADGDGQLHPAIRIFTGTTRGTRRQAQVGERQRIAEVFNARDSTARKPGGVFRNDLVTALCLRERRTSDLIPTTCRKERIVIVPPGTDSLVILLFDVERAPNQPHRDSYDVMVSWLAYPVLRGIPRSRDPQARAGTSLRWPASTQCGRGQDDFCQEEHFVEFIRSSLVTGTTRFTEINFWYTPAIAAAAAGAVFVASER